MSDDLDSGDFASALSAVLAVAAICTLMTLGAYFIGLSSRRGQSITCPCGHACPATEPQRETGP